MIEKRFTIKPSMIVDDVTVIIDNQKEYTFPVLDSTLNYMFCKVLNEQHETIQRLKQNIDELLSINVEEELLKENKQLKYLLKHSCVTEICENCKHMHYYHTNDWLNGIDYDGECLKGLWKEETHECEGFELKSIEELAKDLRIDLNE